MKARNDKYANRLMKKWVKVYMDLLQKYDHSTAVKVMRLEYYNIKKEAERQLYADFLERVW